MTALAITALVISLALCGYSIWLSKFAQRVAQDAKALLERADPFRFAQAVFDKIEADAKARGCTQDISAYRKARQAFTHAALRGRR